MKYFFMLLMFISYKYCSVNSCSDFNIIRATSQVWVGGAKGSGWGTRYVITLISNKSSKRLSIDEMWIGEKYHKITTSKRITYSMPNEDFNTGDTIYITASEYIPENPNIDVKEKEKPINQTPPFTYQGEALIGYELNNKKKYCLVSNFEKLPRLSYP